MRTGGAAARGRPAWCLAGRAAAHGRAAARARWRRRGLAGGGAAAQGRAVVLLLHPPQIRHGGLHQARSKAVAAGWPASPDLGRRR
ncbi:hypothetical protein ACP70R_015508 [Stipagrostis hirtigluma subsp. patula]